MKKLTSLFTLLSLSFALSNCAYNNPGASNAQRDATTGALIGAGAGALIGHQSGRGLEGAAVGAAVGGAGGYVVGDQKDRNQRYGY